MKYLKSIIIFFIILLTFSLITTILYYFNITNSSINNIFKIITFILAFLVSGINIGRSSNKKGWLEGLKVSLILVAFFILMSLITKYNFNIKQFLYYILCIIITILGSMIGINKKRN